ncbi:MAG: hypothetical protein ACLUOS_14055 [Odoribacter splanchnicus]
MYEKNDEATIKRGSERFMVNFNNTYKFTPWLAASVAGTFQRKKAETSGVTVAELRNLAPYEHCWKRTELPTTWGLEPVDCEDLNLQNHHTGSFYYVARCAAGNIRRNTRTV